MGQPVDDFFRLEPVVVHAIDGPQHNPTFLDALAVDDGTVLVADRDLQPVGPLDKKGQCGSLYALVAVETFQQFVLLGALQVQIFDVRDDIEDVRIHRCPRRFSDGVGRLQDRFEERVVVVTRIHYFHVKIFGACKPPFPRPPVTFTVRHEKFHSRVDRGRRHHPTTPDQLEVVSTFPSAVVHKLQPVEGVLPVDELVGDFHDVVPPCSVGDFLPRVVADGITLVEGFGGECPKTLHGRFSNQEKALV